MGKLSQDSKASSVKILITAVASRVMTLRLGNVFNNSCCNNEHNSKFN